MKKTIKIIALLFIVFLLPACNLPGWSTYTNATYGFQLQYPSAGSVVSDTPTAARIQLPISPGTNLSEKYLDISVVDGASPCLSPEAAGYAPGTLIPVSLVINGLNWVRVSAGEGAAGSYYEWTGYSTASGSVCVSLTFILHSHPPDVYSTPPPTFDKPVESAVFPTIVATFTWLSGPLSPFTPTPTPVATYTPTPVSSFTPTPVSSFTPTLVASFTPTAVSLFFVPHLNAYCRRGPDPIFDAIGLAMKGQSYLIDGRNADDTYYFLRLTASVECWVLANTGTASGDTLNVRVMLPIPTPTFTPPPAQPINCGQYTTKSACEAVQACSWVQINDKTGLCKNK